MSRLQRLLNRLLLRTKLAILLFILSFSFLLGLSALYIFSYKAEQASNRFYDTNIMMVTSLNEIKDTYSINIVDTMVLIRDKKISHEDGIEILCIARELIKKEWATHIKHARASQYYKDKKYYINKAESEADEVDEHIEELIEYLNTVKDFHTDNQIFNKTRLATIDITDDINDLLKIERDYAFELKRDSELMFEKIKEIVFPALILLFLVIIAFFTAISRNIEILNEDLKDKSDDLKELYNDLETTLHLFDSGEFVLFKWNNDNKWSIDYVSKNVEDLLGYTQADFLHSGLTYSHLINPHHLDIVLKEIEDNSKDKTINSFIHQPYQVTKKDGSMIWVYESTKISRDSDGNIISYIGYINDISSYIEQSERIEEEKDKFFHLANHDALTNLPNRMMFDDRVYQAIKIAHRQKNKLAVLFIDLDHFKEINDSLGHDTGDIVLQHIAKRIQDLIRTEDSVARLGGDEFTVLLHSINSLDDAAKVSQKILEDLKAPIYIGESELYVTSSIGISLYPEDGDSTVELLKNADAAMYKAKDNGRNKFEFYTKDMTEIALKKVKLETEIRRALLNKELELYYQPQVDINSDELTGAEALLRWNSPSRGMVSPAEFIPIIENSTLIIEITDFVIDTASAQIVKWKNESLNIPKISINLSGRDMTDKNLISRIFNVLEKNRCQPSWIELEITEGFLMHNILDTIEKLNQFRSMGMEISIDDFGTGYSSLSYLKKLPISKLKIDQSFVKDMQNGHNDRSIIMAVIALSKSMNLKVIAEGVETKEQQAILQDDHCDEMQGYIFSKALKAKDFEAMLVTSKEKES